MVRFSKFKKVMKTENELHTNLIIFSTREPLEDREFMIGKVNRLAGQAFG